MPFERAPQQRLRCPAWAQLAIAAWWNGQSLSDAENVASRSPKTPHWLTLGFALVTSQLVHVHSSAKSEEP